MERDAVAKSTAMGVVEFAMSEQVQSDLRAFLEGDCNWVEMVNMNTNKYIYTPHIHSMQQYVNLDTETIESAGSNVVIAGEPLAPHLTNEDGRFLALRLPNNRGGTLTSE